MSNIINNNLDNNMEMYILTDEDLERINGGCHLYQINGRYDHGRIPSERSQIPGFNCNNCHQFIPLTIQAVYYKDAIVCPHCQTRYKIDRSKSSIKKYSCISYVSD